MATVISSFDPTIFSYLKVCAKPTRRIPPKRPLPKQEAQEVGSNLHQFRLFSQLPLELQRRIWYYAAHQPRVAEVHEAKLYAWYRYTDMGSTSIRSQSCAFTHRRSKTADPPLLRVCRESRDVSLTVYTKTALMDPGNHFCADSVYFDFRATMYLTYDNFLFRACRRNANPYYSQVYHIDSPMRKVRSIAFDIRNLKGVGSSELQYSPSGQESSPDVPTCASLAKGLCCLLSLGEIILVANQYQGTTADDRLSVINFHKPSPKGRLTMQLERGARVLTRELRKIFEEANAQNRQDPAFVRRAVPRVEIMVTKLRWTK